MARAANATVHLGARVVTVEQQSDDTYTLTVTQSEGQGDASGSRGQGGVGVNGVSESATESSRARGVSESMGPYDAVVIASPLEFSGVKVKLLKGDTHVGLVRAYTHDEHCTCTGGAHGIAVPWVCMTPHVCTMSRVCIVSLCVCECVSHRRTQTCQWCSTDNTRLLSQPS